LLFLLNERNSKTDMNFEIRCFLPLLEYDQLGRKVIISRPGCFDPYLHKAHDIEKANFMVSEIMGTEDEEIFFRGLVMIIDMEGYSLGHMTQRPLAVTKNHLQFLQVLSRPTLPPV